MDRKVSTCRDSRIGTINEWKLSNSKYEEIKFEKTVFSPDRSIIPFEFSTVDRIVIRSTIAVFVSGCGLFDALLLASSLCYVAHFKCEQGLNSNCSRRFQAQHTSWRSNALLSNASLTSYP